MLWEPLKITLSVFGFPKIPQFSLKKHGPDHRFLAIREALKQPSLTGMEDQLDLPFPTMSFDSVKYKVNGVVTNHEIAGDELIWWYRKRCGKSEQAAQSHTVFFDKPSGTGAQSCQIPGCSTDRGTSIQRDTL